MRKVWSGAVFLGLHERQLDDKGRVALPAPFRALLGDRCYLTVGENRCIDVLTAEAFEATVQGLSDRVDRGEVELSRLRAVTHNASDATIDRQGRVKVDDRLRTYAQIGLPSKVLVAGSGGRAEIWSAAVYAEEQARADLALARGTR
jgi:MraZ protein